MSSVLARLSSAFGARAAVFGAFALFVSLPSLSATIASQDFGQDAPGNVVQQSIQIPAITPGPATFSLQYSIGDFSLGSCTANGNGCALSVSFDPTKAGLRQDAVIVKDANGNVAEEIFLHGVGLGPIPVFSPAVAVYKSLITPSDSLGIEGMAVEADGKILVLDTGTIYRFDPATNNLSTVATLSTDSGPLPNLTLIAVDAAANIYYTIANTSEIHVINAITQTDSVVASHVNPGDMIVDPSGTLFYTQGDQVFKIAPNSSVPTLVAGNGTHGYAGDGGPALQAEFAYPFGIAVDLLGNVYIADGANQRVRKVDTAGNISTVAGNGSNQGVGDGGLAINAGLDFPSLIAVDAVGDIYVTTGFGDVRRIDSGTGLISIIAGANAQTMGTASTKNPFLTVGSASSAQNLGVSGGNGSMVLDPDGNLWAGIFLSYQHVLFEISTASLPIQFAYAAVGGPTESQTVSLLNAGPAALTQPVFGISEQSAQYFSQTNNCPGSIEPGTTCQFNITFTPGAEMAPVAGVTLSDNAASSPQSIPVSASSGGLLPAAEQLGSVAAGNSSAPQTFNIQFPGNASGLTTQLAYGTDFQLGTVSCTGTGTVSCSVSAIFTPQYPGVRRDAVQILDSSGAVVYQLYISGVGQAPQWFVLPAATGTIPMPSTRLWLSAIDAAGNLYAIDTYAYNMSGTQVYKYTKQTGQWSVIAGVPIASIVDEGDGGPATAAILSYLYGVAVDSGGNLYIAETFAIRRVDSRTGIITTISHEGGDSIAVDGLGNVYFLNVLDKVRKLNPATGAIVDYAGNGQPGSGGDGGPATSASFEFPQALAFDNSGNLLITDDTGLHKIDASTGIISRYANTCWSDNIDVDAAGDIYLPCGELEFVPAGGGTPQVVENGPVNIYSPVLRDAAGTFYFSDGTTLNAASLAPALNLGVAGVGGQPSTSSISLTNAGNATVSSPSVSLSGTNAAAFAETNPCAQAVAPGQSCTVNLSFSPTAVETQTATLAVTSSAGNLQTTLSGTGVTTSISLTPQQLQFPSTGVSLSSYQSISILNQGSSLFSIASLSITGPNASDFSVSSTCPETLSSYRRCQLQVLFSPTVPGTRTATLNLADDATGSPQTIPLSGTAAECTFSLSANAVWVGAAGGTENIGVTPSGACGWIAYPSDSWLSIASGSSGIGSGSVVFTAAPNAASRSRSTNLTIAGQTVTINQDAAGACEYDTTPNYVRVPPEGGNRSFTITADLNCGWTANSNVSWLTISNAAFGSGNGSISYTIDPNPANTERTAIINIAGETVTIEQSAAGETSPGLQFIPVTPCRVIDTRSSNGLFGGPLITGQTSRDFSIPNGSCGIPAGAQAYALNITVVPSASLRFLTIWPAGQPQPTASTLNSYDGRIKANAAIVPAGATGGVSVFATDDTHVVLDITGYFVPLTSNSGLAFYPLPPCRIADTRTQTGDFGGPYMPAHQTRDFPILSSACNIPASAQAYSLNFTVIPVGKLSFLTTWPSGQSQPTVSTLNAPTGTVTANAAILPAGTNGNISVFATDDTNLVIDINGYFAPLGPGGLLLYNLPPCRVLDTRTMGAQPFTGGMNVSVGGSACAVPNAQAYVLNATVVPAGSLAYLSLWPTGAAPPVVSTLNADDASVTSNMAIVPAANASISAYTSNSTHLILDIFGYFAP